MTVSGSQLLSLGPVTEDALSSSGVSSSGVKVGTGWTCVEPCRGPKPEERQTMLFSATLSQDIMQLASRWMRPEIKVVEIDPEHVLADGIDETVYAVTTAEKIPVMLWLFKHEVRAGGEGDDRG